MFDIIGYWSAVSIFSILGLFFSLNVIYGLLHLWSGIITDGESEELLEGYFLSFYSRIGFTEHTRKKKYTGIDGKYKMVTAEELNGLHAALMLASGIFTVLLAVSYFKLDVLPTVLISEWSLYITPVVSWVTIVPLTMLITTGALRKLYKLGKAVNSLVTTKETKDES